MEIDGLGSGYYNSLYATTASTLNNAPDFLGMIERAQRSQNNPSRSTDAFPASYSTKQPIDKNDELYQLCLDLESFIIKNLLNTMRNTVQKSGLVDDSFAGKMYEDMLYDEYAKEFTKSANFGLAEQAYRQLRNYY